MAQHVISCLTEPSRDVPLYLEFGVGVLGAGPDGNAAAALNGADALLVEHYCFLGGIVTAAGVPNFCGLHASSLATS